MMDHTLLNLLEAVNDLRDVPTGEHREHHRQYRGVTHDKLVAAITLGLIRSSPSNAASAVYEFDGYILTDKGTAKLEELKKDVAQRESTVEPACDNGMQETELLSRLRRIYNDGEPAGPVAIGMKLRDIDPIVELGLVEDRVSLSKHVLLTEAGRKILWFMQGGTL